MMIGFGCGKADPTTKSPKPPDTNAVTKVGSSQTVKAAKVKDGVEQAGKQTQPEKKSTMTLAIEGVTGKTAIDAGKKAETKINNISAKHNHDLNEVMGE
jgi:hypothetical protein